MAESARREREEAGGGGGRGKAVEGYMWPYKYSANSGLNFLQVRQV